MKHIKIRAWVKVVFFLIIISTLIFIYGRYIEAKMYKTKEYSIINSSIPENFYGFKIVQISDIKFNYSDKDYLKDIVKEINRLKPDIVLFTGDLFNKKNEYNDKNLNELSKILKEIDCTTGKFAIRGDNDINNEDWEKVIKNSDFIDLNDKSELIYNNGIDPILIVGISSNYKKNHIKDTIDDIYSNINEEYKYSILMIHEPDFINYIDYSKFNLILAGHSLNGQIKIPFIGGIIKNKYSNIYYDEYYNLGNTDFYISSGITSEINFRLFNRPSISLYRLRNK